MASEVSSHSSQPSAGASAALLCQGRRRGLFAVLAQLADLGIAPVDSLPIAAASCGDDLLASHACRLHAAVQQGQSLLQAFQSDETFWGKGTIRVISRSGSDQPARAFHQLARGAAEPWSQRALVSCFGISRRRSALSVAALLAGLALWLPILPHQRGADGRVIIDAFGRHESLMPGDYDIDIKAALTRSSIPVKDLDWESGDGGATLQSLRKVLQERTGRPRIASCLASYSNVLAMLAGYHEVLSYRDRLAPSPVPMVWLIRRIRLERWMALKNAADTRFISDAPVTGYSRSLAKLAQECPEIQPDRP